MAESLPAVMGVDWSPDLNSVRISITTLDELGIPIDRRGIRTDVPRPADIKTYANEAAELVRRTLLHIFLRTRNPLPTDC